MDTVVRDWTLVELDDGQQPTLHVLGFLLKHPRLEVGEPYISSPVRRTGLRTVINGRGVTTLLDGDPLPEDQPLPEDFEAMMRRAQIEWVLPVEATWRRVTINT